MLHMPSLLQLITPVRSLIFIIIILYFLKSHIPSLFSPVYLSCLQGQMMKMPRLTKGCPHSFFFFFLCLYFENGKKKGGLDDVDRCACVQQTFFLFLLRLVY